MMYLTQLYSHCKDAGVVAGFLRLLYVMGVLRRVLGLDGDRDPRRAGHVQSPGTAPVYGDFPGGGPSDEVVESVTIQVGGCDAVGVDAEFDKPFRLKTQLRLCEDPQQSVRLVEVVLYGGHLSQSQESQVGFAVAVEVAYRDRDAIGDG